MYSDYPHELRISYVLFFLVTEIKRKICEYYHENLIPIASFFENETWCDKYESKSNKDNVKTLPHVCSSFNKQLIWL